MYLLFSKIFIFLQNRHKFNIHSLMKLRFTGWFCLSWSESSCNFSWECWQSLFEMQHLTCNINFYGMIPTKVTSWQSLKFFRTTFLRNTPEQLLLKTYPKVIHGVFDTEVLPALDSVFIETLHPPSNFMKLDGMWGWGECFIRRGDVLTHQPSATLPQSLSAIQKEHSVFRSHFKKKK